MYRKKGLDKYLTEINSNKEVEYSIDYFNDSNKTPFVWLDNDLSNMDKIEREKYVKKL